MAVTVKMGVDLGSFTSGIRQGQQILKGLNAEMKNSEAEFKATGNAEQRLASQTKTLNSQIQVQKGIADQAQQAMAAMVAAGIDPTDAAYQKLYATMMNATAGMNNAQAALNALTGGSEDAKKGADDLKDSLQGIDKKISLSQVKSGIDSITSGLENAARKAVDLGQKLWDTIMDSARRADDTATMADMYGIDLDTFQRMQRLVADGMDTSVESILKGQKKLKKGIGDENKATLDALKDLGLATETIANKNRAGGFEIVTEDSLDLMFRAGQALLNMSDAYDKETAAQAMFGRSWEELVPLFKEYKTVEEYNKALEGVTVNSEDTVRDLAALNDAVGNLEASWTVLKDELIGAIAPALTKGADAISGLLDKLTEYLKTPEGKQALADLSTAVSGLFEDLGKIDPQDVVSGFTEVFNTVVSSVQWLTEHWNEVVTAMESIVGGWALLKVTGGILDVVQIVAGLKTLTGATAAGEAAGAAWGSGFASTVLKAAPWLLFLYETLKPSASASDDLDVMFSNGKVTTAGWEYWNNNKDAWEAQLQKVADRYGNTSEWIGNAEALNIIGNLSISEEEMYRQLEEQIGLVPLPAVVDIPADTAEQLEEQIGTVNINGVIHFVDADGNNVGVNFGDEKGEYIGGHGRRKKANGIWSVPYDNYLAYLHKGERVMTAREVQSRSYNSNLYVESMIMNNGTDAAGLAAAMAAAQQRQMSGYGS